MPKLPSGINFAISDILPDDLTDLRFSALRKCVLASARHPRDLYGLLEVILFAPEAEVAGYVRAEISNLDTTDVPYYSRMSFLSFLEQLSVEDQEHAIRWISEPERQSWIIHKIFEPRRSDITHLMRMMNQQQPSFLQESVAIYKPDHLALNSDVFFASEGNDWDSYRSDTGFMRIKPMVMPGICGIQGVLALGNPPKPVALVDAWEASKPAGTWDYWEFLQFLTIPSGDGSLNLVVYFPESTFFDRPYEVVATFPWGNDQDSDGDLNSISHSGLITQWQRFLKLLEGLGFLGNLSEQTWTIDGEVYTWQSPSES